MSEKHARHPTRPIYPMPDDIRSAPLMHGLLEAYQQRPAYQQNDYLGWIALAKCQ